MLRSYTNVFCTSSTLNFPHPVGVAKTYFRHGQSSAFRRVYKPRRVSEHPNADLLEPRGAASSIPTFAADSAALSAVPTVHARHVSRLPTSATDATHDAGSGLPTSCTRHVRAATSHLHGGADAGVQHERQAGAAASDHRHQCAATAAATIKRRRRGCLCGMWCLCGLSVVLYCHVGVGHWRRHLSSGSISIAEVLVGYTIRLRKHEWT